MTTPYTCALEISILRKYFWTFLSGLCDRRRVLAQVEEYDTTTDTYNIVTELPRMIVMFGIVAVGKKIYLVGGKDPLTCLTLDTVLVFDLEHNTWSTSFPSLREARSANGYNPFFFTVSRVSLGLLLV